LLVTAGQNIERLRDDGAFAALCGASPIPVSSGRRNRHRHNPGGDRDANRTLHMIAVVPLRYCQRSRAYAQRRVTEGTNPFSVTSQTVSPLNCPRAVRRA
jgi:transposase